MWEIHKYIKIKKHTPNNQIKEEITGKLGNGKKSMKIKLQHTKTYGIQCPKGNLSL